jgi:hypothetical protein
MLGLPALQNENGEIFLLQLPPQGPQLTPEQREAVLRLVDETGVEARRVFQALRDNHFDEQRARAALRGSPPT